MPLSYPYAETGDPLYQIGDSVVINQALTKLLPNNKYSTAIHAPISGIISNIGYYPTLQSLTNLEKNLSTASTVSTVSIEITADINNSNKSSSHAIPQISKDFIKTIYQSGIIGLGGAGFPTGYKLSNNINTIIINAMECEPPIDVDNCLIINYSDEIIAGCNILNNILQPKEIIIAIKSSMTEAISCIQLAINHNADPKIKLQILPNGYPNGYSKTLIKLVTKKEIPYNKHSNDYGITCLNIATIYAIEQAINHQSPLTKRLITIAGENLKYPGNYLIPIGTTIKTILESCDINLQNIANQSHSLSIKIGGNYMGAEIFNSNNSVYLDHIDLLYKTGVEKTTQCIIIDYQEKSSSIKRKYSVYNNIQPCIKCGFCETVCPMDLLPQQLYWFRNNDAQLETYNINACITCGLCDTACPSNIPLTAVFKNLKNNIHINKLQQNKARIAEINYELTLKRQEEEKNKLHARKTSTHKNLLKAALERAKGKNNP